jgi:hypothetical protein
MEVLAAASLIANIQAVLQLTFHTFSGLLEYCQSVKRAPEKSNELRAELLLVSDVLKDLETNMQLMIATQRADRLTSFKEALRHFADILKAMNRKIPEKPDLIQRLKWPFSQRENEAYLSKVERFKSIFTLFLSSSQGYPFSGSKKNS